ncbi:MAG: hypothetical protein MRZ79_21785 [Bacteroidia bacterium]|nr:hypothetical protein [Bacteroidia bacterium]
MPYRRKRRKAPDKESEPIFSPVKKKKAAPSLAQAAELKAAKAEKARLSALYLVDLASAATQGPTQHHALELAQQQLGSGIRNAQWLTSALERIKQTLLQHNFVCADEMAERDGLGLSLGSNFAKLGPRSTAAKLLSVAIKATSLPEPEAAPIKESQGQDLNTRWSMLVQLLAAGLPGQQLTTGTYQHHSVKKSDANPRNPQNGARNSPTSTE